MQSRRSSRESNKSRSHRKNKDVSNEIETLSSQNLADDSPDYSLGSQKTRRSSHSAKKDRKTDDDTEDYFSDIGRRKEIFNKKKAKSSESKEDSTEDILSDEAHSNKERSSKPGRKKARKNRKSTRMSESNSHESIGDRESSSKKDSAKGRRTKHQLQKETEKANELPITEILKKAQQQRTKYEEPTPLPELTASTVYVQDMNGFSAIKIQDKHSRHGSKSMPLSSSARPVEVAIVFQKIWRSGGFIFQGLLGGMAMLHLIFMETYFKNSEKIVGGYSQLVEIYGSCFSFLIAMCLISVFDRFDLAHTGKKHFRQIFQYHLKSILAFPLYIAAFSLHQATSKVDDKLTLLLYNSSNYTYPYNDVTKINEGIGIGELKTWQRMTLLKDVVAVLGWTFISLGNREDMLLEHLKDMSKYEDDAD